MEQVLTPTLPALSSTGTRSFADRPDLLLIDGGATHAAVASAGAGAACGLSYSHLRHGEGRPPPHPGPGYPRGRGDRHPRKPGHLLPHRPDPGGDPPLRRRASTASGSTSGCAARCSTLEKIPGVGETRRARAAQGASAASKPSGQASPGRAWRRCSAPAGAARAVYRLLSNRTGEEAIMRVITRDRPGAGGSKSCPGWKPAPPPTG